MKKKKVVIPLSIPGIVLLCLVVFAHTMVFNVFSCRIHFPEEHIGANLKMEDGKTFTVLRRLQVEGENNNSDGYAIFKVRFKFKSLKLETNKRLSMIPAPFLMGMRGFREKYWTFNEDTDYFQGIYQWESKGIAEKYPDSFIYKLMTKRAAPGSLSYEIITNMDISKYIQKISSDYQN